MHYHLEIIMPPATDVAAAIEKLMAPFSETADDEIKTHPFWDWYVIGGRYSGTKLEAFLGKDRIDGFCEEIKKRNITVSSVQAGKPELSPTDQIPIVDALWCETFPDSPVKICPLFGHFNNQYKNSDGYPDIMPLKDMPKNLKAHAVMIAGPDLDVEFLIHDEMWNGVTHVKSSWDGHVASALTMCVDKVGRYKEEYRAARLPADDWLVVTVDYHN